MLKSHDTMRNIQFEVAAARRIDNDHDRDTLVVLVRDQARALIGVIRIQLNQVSPLADLSLDWITQLVCIGIVTKATTTIISSVISCKSHLK